MDLHATASYDIMIEKLEKPAVDAVIFQKDFVYMKFRFQILSTNKQRQRDVRNFGLLLLVIGLCLHDPGQSSLKYLGILMLLWSGMSWLAEKAWSAEWLPDSAWVHVVALAILILLDIRIGSVIRITESAIDTLSKQMLQKDLSKPPEKPKPMTKFKHGDTIRSIAFSPVDASLLASAGGDTIKLWNQNSPNTPEILRFEPYTDSVDSIAFSPDGERLVTGGSNGITLWSIPERRFIKTFDYDTGVVAFSPDGQRMAEAAWDLNLWNISIGGNFEKTSLFKHDKHNTFVPAIAFSPDGKWLVSGDAQGEIKVWDIHNAQAAISPLKGGNSRIRALKFSPGKNNFILASAGHGDVKLWRTQDWQIAYRISTGTVLDLAFSPDGNILAGVGWDTVNLWTSETGAHILSLKKRSRSIAFSIDGTTLATGGTDGTLRIWDVTPAALSQQSDPQDVVRMVYFLPEGSRSQLGIRAKIDKMIRKIQHFYAAQMENHGFGRKTFTFETDSEGEAAVYLVTGKFTAAYYLEKTLTKVEKEIGEHFDLSKNVYFIVVELGSKRIDDHVCGLASINPIWSGGELWQAQAGTACIPTFKNCFNWKTAAHELGHAFGLKHDFRDASYIMSYGKTPNRLSRCAAHWLHQSRFFKSSQSFFDAPATIEIQHSSQPSISQLNDNDVETIVDYQTPPVFRATDADGIHQIQLLISPIDESPPPGYRVSKDEKRNQNSWDELKTEGKFVLHKFREINGEKRAATGLLDAGIKKVTIQVIDTHGNITWRRFDLSEDLTQSIEKP